MLNLLYLAVAILPFTIGASTTSQVSDDVSSNTQPLTQGSCFMLLTSLFLAVVFHPLSGSLIYGPTNRFWMAAPTSILAELSYMWLMIITTFVEAAQQRNPRIIRTFAQRLIAFRMLNTLDGDHKHSVVQSGEDADVVKLVDAMMDAISEGSRIRIAIALPIIAQFTKLIVVQGPHTIILRVLGVLYFIHWATLEFLSTIRAHDETLEIVKDLKAFSVTFFHYAAGSDSNESSESISSSIFDYWKHYDIDTASGPTLIGVEEMSMYFHLLLAAIVLIVGTLLGLWSTIAFAVVASLTLVVRTQRTLALRKRVINSLKLNSIWAWKYKHLQGIGADIGMVFFACWISFCIFDYDSTGTSRPQWPWLDWLG